MEISLGFWPLRAGLVQGETLRLLPGRLQEFDNNPVTGHCLNLDHWPGDGVRKVQHGA